MNWKWVAPVDGSAASERIIPHVAELRRAVDAGVNLVHVTGTDAVSRMKGRDYLRSLGERAEKILSIQGAALRSGEPALEILKYAEAEGADLIAFTTRGGSPLRRVLFGNTAIELLTTSRVPLFVTRPEWRVRPIRRILAAIGVSRHPRGALRMAADLARERDAEIILARVRLQEEPEESAESCMKGAADSLAGEGVRVDTIVGSGDPARSILDAARKTNSDLIAFGALGRRGVDRFFFGSVSESILLGSGVPLLIHRGPRSRRIQRLPEAGSRI